MSKIKNRAWTRLQKWMQTIQRPQLSYQVKEFRNVSFEKGSLAVNQVTIRTPSGARFWLVRRWRCHGGGA